jgi:uncharacterized lipoprotein YmbA
MSSRKQFPQVIVALAVGAALAGCASRPQEHFYTVSTADHGSGEGVESQRIKLSPIVIPALIDRPQLVVRTDRHEVVVLENHRWAEPLSADLTRALGEDLRRSLPAFQIVEVNAPSDRTKPAILDVEITDLISGPGPSTSLQASWVLHDRARTCIRSGALAAQIPTQAGDDAIAGAYADAMSRLARAIAQTIPASGLCAGD